jgi:drug/metabolite transporter (DMT)-like permease
MSEAISARSSKGIGVAAGILSAAAYGGMSFVVHFYGVEFPATEIIFCRAIFALIILAPLALKDRRFIFSGESLWLWSRSLFGALSILSFTWNLQHTSIGFANVLFNVAPLGVLAFVWTSRSERLSVGQTFCLLLVVGGSLIFWGQASASAEKTIYLVGLGGAIAAAASYISLKRASLTCSPFTLTWGISLLSIPVTLLLKHGAWKPLNQRVLLPLILIAGLCTIGQIFVALSYRWAELSTATAIVPSTMAFGILIDALSVSAMADRQILGCAVYLAGCIPLTMMKSRSTDDGH